MNIESYVEDLVREAMNSESEPELGLEPEPELTLEAVLTGRAIELWSDALGERFWLVADEADASRLGEPRGAVYTAAEARLIIAVNDASVVAEIHRWKRRFDGRFSETEWLK